MHISGFIGQTETRPLICNYTYPSVFSPIFCTSTGYYSWLKLALKWFPCKILLGCYGNERWKIHGAATIIPWPQQCESLWRLIIRNINEGGRQRSSQIVINLQLIVCEEGNNNGIWWDNSFSIQHTELVGYEEANTEYSLGLYHLRSASVFKETWCFMTDKRICAFCSWDISRRG